MNNDELAKRIIDHATNPQENKKLRVHVFLDPNSEENRRADELAKRYPDALVVKVTYDRGNPKLS